MGTMFNNVFVGQTASLSKTFTYDEIVSFAEMSGDRNPLHLDAAAAKESGFEGEIVHGALLNALISAVIGMELPGQGTIYMEQDSRFLKPVYIGERVTAVVTVDSIIKPEKGIIKLKTSVKNQSDEVVLDGFAIVKVKRQKSEVQAS